LFPNREIQEKERVQKSKTKRLQSNMKIAPSWERKNVKEEMKRNAIKTLI